MHRDPTSGFHDMSGGTGLTMHGENGGPNTPRRHNATTDATCPPRLHRPLVRRRHTASVPMNEPNSTF